MRALIKLYGERNTNTNYLSKLIRLNLNVEELPGTIPPGVKRLQSLLHESEWVADAYFRLRYGRTLGWKHTRAKPAEKLRSYAVVRRNLAIVTITKNPYSWLLSLHRRPYHQRYLHKPDFETFLRTPWKPVGRDNLVGTLPTPVALWNLKNASYLQLAALRALNSTAEQIFEDPERVIRDISERFSIERLSKDFVDYRRSTKGDDVDTDYYRDYYLNERWREKLSGEAIDFINEHVDSRLMAHFGYRLLP